MAVMSDSRLDDELGVAPVEFANTPVTEIPERPPLWLPRDDAGGNTLRGGQQERIR